MPASNFILLLFIAVPVVITLIAWIQEGVANFYQLLSHPFVIVMILTVNIYLIYKIIELPLWVIFKGNRRKTFKYVILTMATVLTVTLSTGHIESNALRMQNEANKYLNKAQSTIALRKELMLKNYKKKHYDTSYNAKEEAVFLSLFERLWSAITFDYIIHDFNIEKHVRNEILNLGSGADLNHLDVGRVTNMDYLFFGLDFNGDISKWDVSKVKSAHAMFDFSTFSGIPPKRMSIFRFAVGALLPY